MLRTLERLTDYFRRIKTPRLELVLGDITTIASDAIVNAAKSSLLGGGGVDGAIHAAAGPGLLAECRAIRRTTRPDGLDTGGAVTTAAYDLPAQYVIHTVGPVFARQPYVSLLRSCYTRSLAAADELGCETVSFPLISAGVYGWPVPDAIVQASIAIGSFRARHVRTVRLVLFDQRTYDLARTVLGRP